MEQANQRKLVRSLQRREDRESLQGCLQEGSHRRFEEQAARDVHVRGKRRAHVERPCKAGNISRQSSREPGVFLGRDSPGVKASRIAVPTIPPRSCTNARIAARRGLRAPTRSIPRLNPSGVAVHQHLFPVSIPPGSGGSHSRDRRIEQSAADPEEDPGGDGERDAEAESDVCPTSSISRRTRARTTSVCSSHKTVRCILEVSLRRLESESVVDVRLLVFEVCAVEPACPAAVIPVTDVLGRWAMLPFESQVGAPRLRELKMCVLGCAEGEEQEERRPDELSRQSLGQRSVHQLLLL